MLAAGTAADIAVARREAAERLLPCGTFARPERRSIRSIALSC